jgi:hypothetical protein
MIERIAEAVKKALLPELEKLSARMDRMEGRLEELSHRLGGPQRPADCDADASSSARLDQTNARLDQTNARLDKVHSDLIGRIDELRRE